MSWVKENCVSFFQLFCIKVIKTGRIPDHVAFIMDGNRRYAKKFHVESSVGHHRGFDKLSETLKWCLDLGISEVTVYAFSIENFKRSDEEVGALMELARDKFGRLLDETDQMNEWGVQINVAGRLSLLPNDVQVLLSKAVLATKNNNKLKLNIAYAYTARDEISRAASHIVDGVRNSELLGEDINAELVSNTLELKEPELLVRTSGELRLSDFMLWQLSNTVLYFSDVLWPEFSLWNFLAAILHYQRHAPFPAKKADVSERSQQFLQNVKTRQWQELEKLVAC